MTHIYAVALRAPLQTNIGAPAADWLVACVSFAPQACLTLLRVLTGEDDVPRTDRERAKAVRGYTYFSFSFLSPVVFAPPLSRHPQVRR